ncbi:hypothetical protein LCGC14_1367670, partial [marine sediment metagenome]
KLASPATAARPPGTIDPARLSEDAGEPEEAEDKISDDDLLLEPTAKAESKAETAEEELRQGGAQEVARGIGPAGQQRGVEGPQEAPSTVLGPFPPAVPAKVLDPAYLGAEVYRDPKTSPLEVPPQQVTPPPSKLAKGISLKEQAEIRAEEDLTKEELQASSRLGISKEADARRGRRGRGGRPARQSRVRPVAKGDAKKESPRIDLTDVVKTDDKGFLTDTAGRIGIPIDTIIKKIKGIKKTTLGWARRFGLSRGDLPQEVHESKRIRLGKIGKIQADIGFAVIAYDRAAQEAFGGILNVNGAKMVNLYMQGELDVKELPEVMRAPAGMLRSTLDSMSQRLIDEGIIEGDLAVVVANNMKSYVTRSFRVFDDPKWADKVPEDIRNNAKAWVRREFPDKSEKEINGYIKQLLYEGKAAQAPIALLAKAQLGSKDLSVFKKKNTELPEELRALYGEYTDPRVNYARSMMKIGHIIANHEFLSEVKEFGLGKFLAEAGNPIESEYGDLIAPLSSETNIAMAPLNGLLTTPEIAAAFKRETSPEGAPDWLRLYFKVNAAVKAGKTIYSPMTQTRNLIGNIGFAMMQGHWRVGMSKKAWKTTWAVLTKKTNAEIEAYYSRATELLVVGQSVHAGEFRDIMKDAWAASDIEEFVLAAEERRAHKFKSLIKMSTKKATELYQAGDDVWKLYAWENEKARYQKYRPDLSEKEIEELTAKIVTDTYPTYSLVPEGIRLLRRFPAIGMFVSFPSEVYRTTYKTLELAYKEMKDPRTRAIGATRLAGVFAMATVIEALSAFSMWWWGVSREEDEKLRKFRQPWQDQHTFVHYGNNKNASVYGSIDMTYSDPHGTLKSPIRAFWRGDSFLDGMLDGIKEAAAPFVSADLLIKTIKEAASGTVDGRAGAVWKRGDTGKEIAVGIAKHTWKKLQPGITSQAEKVVKGTIGYKEKNGRTYNALTEILAISTGQRMEPLDIEHAIPFKLGDFKQAKSSATRKLSRILQSKGYVSAGQIKSAYRTSEDRRQRAYKEGSEMVLDAKSLAELSWGELRTIMAGNDVTKADMNSLISGSPPPFKLSKQLVSAMRKANPKEFKDRMVAITKAIKEENSKKK